MRMGRGEDIVDIAGLTPARDDRSAPRASLRGRPWLAILFRCCRVYSRIYRSADGRAYQGRCPKCCRPLRVPVGPDGTANRFFEAE